MVWFGDEGAAVFMASQLAAWPAGSLSNPASQLSLRRNNTEQDNKNYDNFPNMPPIYTGPVGIWG